MQITINEEEIDYTLENEQNLYDVLGSLRSWLGTEGYLLASAERDDREVDLNSEDALFYVHIAMVGRLKIRIESAMEKEYRDLLAVNEYFQVLGNAIVAENAEAVAKVLEDYPFIKAGIDNFLERNGIPTASFGAPVIDKLIAESGIIESRRPSEDNRAGLLAYITSLTHELVARIREFESPNDELIAAAEALRSLIDQLNDVAIMLQTGRDTEAMDAIVRFAELSGKIIRLYPLLKQREGTDFNEVQVEGTSFPDFYADLNAILSELIDAFTADDSVLIGDLLEYEVSPRLERLRDFIDLLTEG